MSIIDFEWLVARSYCCCGSAFDSVVSCPRFLMSRRSSDHSATCYIMWTAIHPLVRPPWHKLVPKHSTVMITDGYICMSMNVISRWFLSTSWNLLILAFALKFQIKILILWLSRKWNYNFTQSEFSQRTQNKWSSEWVSIDLLNVWETQQYDIILLTQQGNRVCTSSSFSVVIGRYSNQSRTIIQTKKNIVSPFVEWFYYNNHQGRSEVGQKGPRKRAQTLDCFCIKQQYIDLPR